MAHAPSTTLMLQAGHSISNGMLTSTTQKVTANWIQQTTSETSRTNKDQCSMVTPASHSCFNPDENQRVRRAVIHQLFLNAYTTPVTPDSVSTFFWSAYVAQYLKWWSNALHTNAQPDENTPHTHVPTWYKHSTTHAAYAYERNNSFSRDKCPLVL